MYPYSENKGADQLHIYCAVDLRLCFHICKNRFSHREAHMMIFFGCKANNSWYKKFVNVCVLSVSYIL